MVHTTVMWSIKLTQWMNYSWYNSNSLSLPPNLLKNDPGENTYIHIIIYVQWTVYMISLHAINHYSETQLAELYTRLHMNAIWMLPLNLNNVLCYYAEYTMSCYNHSAQCHNIAKLIEHSALLRLNGMHARKAYFWVKIVSTSCKVLVSTPNPEERNSCTKGT